MEDQFSLPPSLLYFSLPDPCCPNQFFFSQFNFKRIYTAALVSVAVPVKVCISGNQIIVIFVYFIIILLVLLNLLLCGRSLSRICIVLDLRTEIYAIMMEC